MHRFFAARLLSGAFVALMVCLGSLPLFGLEVAPAAGEPRVIRTMTHHQVTSDARGLWGVLPVVSDSGNKIVFGLNRAADGQPNRLAAIDFEGTNLAVLDAAEGIGQFDITADGKRVVYAVGTEIRSVASDGTGRQVIFKSLDAGIDCLRISGDGRIVVFLISRGMSLKGADGKAVWFDRGVYAINPDGTGFRRVVGPEQVAALRGIKPEEAGNPNFTLEYRAGSIDVSSNGGRLVFGCWAKSTHVLIGCDTNGANVHTIAEIPPPNESGYQFLALALSGDGSTVAYHATRPEELHVAGFDGKSNKLLLKQGPDDQRMAWPSSEPVYITLDGARVTYSGRHFNSDGSGSFQLMAANQEGILRYWEYETPAPDALGRRFAYWPYTPRPLQLATMELNVPWDRLRGAPKITDLFVDPPSIPRQKTGINVVPARVGARVTSDPAPPAVSGTGLRKGVVDLGLSQSGSVGRTTQYDDGKFDGNGDEKAGDGIFTSRWLTAYEATPDDGPWTIRVEAQVTGNDKLFHASVVEFGPFPIVPGSDKVPPPNAKPIDGTPPPPPPVNPGDGGIVTGPNPPPKPPTTAIDLTGFWEADGGAKYYLRQIGKNVYWSADAMPRVRNIFYGSIDGDVLSGYWIDLPGGEIETGTGELKLKIESNDKLTKISSTLAYGASTWIRVKGAKGGGGDGGGPKPPVVIGGGGDGGGGVKLQPWQTPAGRALIDQWANEAMAKINAYKGGNEFNLRKPFRINKYGILEGTKLVSVAAPDNFKDYNNDRYWYMWDYWVPSASTGWRWSEWNAAGVPPLREYVLARLQK